jgi:3-dehydroquinate synthetase
VHDLPRLADWVRRSIVVKARVVSEDERETGFRAALNLGHTVGHALEAYGGFGGLTHGEAISLGLVAALRLGAQWSVTPADLAGRTERLLGKLGLPIDLAARPLAHAAELLGHDKKRGGQSVRFVLCSAPGQIEFRKVGLEELKQRVQSLQA